MLTWTSRMRWRKTILQRDFDKALNESMAAKDEDGDDREVRQSGISTHADLPCRDFAAIQPLPLFICITDILAQQTLKSF